MAKPIDPLNLLLVGGGAFVGYQVLVNGNKPGTVGYKLLHGGFGALSTAVGGGSTTTATGIVSGGNGSSVGAAGAVGPDSCVGYNRALNATELATTNKAAGTTVRQLFEGTYGNSNAAWQTWLSQNGGHC